MILSKSVLSTAILLAGTCFSNSASASVKETGITSREYALIPAATTGTNSTGPQTLAGALEKIILFPDVKNKEARGLYSHSLFEDIVHTAAHTSKPVGLQWLETRVEEIEHALNALKKGGGEGGTAKLISPDEYFLMEKQMVKWINKRIRPDSVFLEWGLTKELQDCTDILTVSRNPKLLLWLNYVNEYKQYDRINPIAAFGDKEMLNFLVGQMKPQESLTLSSTTHENLDPYLQVVTLFEFFRQVPSLKDFVPNVLAHMVSNSVFKERVFKVWLQKEESPSTIFSILRLGDENSPIGLDDTTLFSAWLNYIKLYWESGAFEYNYGNFIDLLDSKTSVSPRLKAMLESDALKQQLGGATNEIFGNHAANLRAMWQILKWRAENKSLQDVFRYLNLEGKRFEPGDLDFMQLILFIDHTAQKAESYPYDEVYELVTRANSYGDLLSLIQWYQQLSQSQDFANGMLKYLAPDAAWERLYPTGIQVMLTDKLQTWFKSSVLYFVRVEDKDFKDALMDVIFLLKKNLLARGMPEKEMAYLFKRLRKQVSVDEAWNALEGTMRLSTGQKRKLLQ